jgi:hypothetical protein
MRRALLAALLVVLVLAATAAGAIVPQKGIAGVSLGMTQAKVRSVLGKPAKIKHGTNSFGKYTQFLYAGLVITFQGNATTTDITTSRASERTSTGAGVGSTESALRAKVKGLTCKTESGFRHCYLGSFRPGKRVTDFRIKSGKVTSVEVGFVSD